MTHGGEHADDDEKGGVVTSGWRFRAGVAIFILGFCAPLGIPFVVASPLPARWKTTLSGALALGVPEVMMLVAAAVMGKQGFAKLKRMFGRFLVRYGPPQHVGPVRYRVGLAMFTLPLLLAWLGPYLHGHLPGFDSHPMRWHVGGDLMFAISLCVLGGEFWDKLCSLFVHGARAVFPDRVPEGGSHE